MWNVLLYSATLVSHFRFRKLIGCETNFVSRTANKPARSCVNLTKAALVFSVSCAGLYMFLEELNPQPLSLPSVSSTEIFWDSSSAHVLTGSLTFHRPNDSHDIVNDMAWLINQAENNGKDPCHFLPTARAVVFGFPIPSSKQNIILPTDQDIEILIVSYSENGSRRCSGGDFYETDLSGPNWKSRPPVTDLGDGSYSVRLRVDSRFHGSYTFKSILLFTDLHGLDQFPADWIQDKTLLSLAIEFENTGSRKPSSKTTTQQLCRKSDYRRRAWRGQWTRIKKNESCSADADGRFRCLPPNERCERPWCDGTVGSLESNGWSYSAHCIFHIFSQEEGWDCLKGKWIYFWGDSNHQDTIRNLVNFVLGFQEGVLPRSFDRLLVNPNNRAEEVHITSRFNGHFYDDNDDLGLDSLRDLGYRESLRAQLSAPSGAVPDYMFLNSGLHDGLRWENLGDFAKSAEKAATFWASIWRNASHDPLRRPKIVYRTTVSPAGKSRGLQANPHKMEVFNTVLGEILVSHFGSQALQIVDAYDMSFPWHYDNVYSDGGHYGRPPSLRDRLDCPNGHQYFIDVMLVHVLLNAMCPV